MPRIESHVAVVPVAANSTPDPAPRAAGPAAGGRPAPGASLQNLAKRAVHEVGGTETGKTAAPAAAPRAALPRANRPRVTASPVEASPVDAGVAHLSPDADAHHDADEAKPQAHEQAGAAPQKLAQSQPAGHATHDAAHAAHHASQIAATKEHHDRLRRLSDFKKRLAEQKSLVLTKLVGG